ncbi:ABC1 family-domain-containing protein [Suillus cothurnatus]|nr:ABC1 family-domain-containing protein [Suillus cothurnatus]
MTEALISADYKLNFMPEHADCIFQCGFNKSPQELFAYFDEQAIASASITQVHKACTWDGDWVTVKVQEPDVGCQTSYDLMTFRAMMWAFEKWAFDLFILLAQWTATLIASEPRLAGKVHIPKVYPEYSTKHVLTVEWIDGRGMFVDTVHNMKKDGIPESMHHVKLRGRMHAIMHTMFELFSAQMFNFQGYVSIFL